MFTRTQLAKEKRNAEEEVKRIEQDKRNKKLHKRRKLIGPYDITVDPNLPKIYLGESVDLGEPGPVKVEVKSEVFEDEEGHMGGDVGVEVFPHFEMEEAGNGVAKIEVFEEEEATEAKNEENAIDAETVEKVLPIILPLLTEKDVFRCRLVNKQWRRIMDKFIENSVVHRPYDDKVYLEKLKSCPYQLYPLQAFRIVKHAYKFETETKLEKFNEAMKGHIGSELSPFVGGTTVTLKNLLVKSSVLSSATKLFLEKFGAYVCRLEIIQKDEDQFEDFDIVGFVNGVKTCLHFVPNLERLKIKSNGLSKCDKSKLAPLKLKLYRNEMMDRAPKLHNLEALEFEYLEILKVDKVCGFISNATPYVPYLEEIFGDIMINPYYQSQLKQLSLDWTNEYVNFQANNVNDLTLANLKCKLSEIKFQVPVQKITLLKCYSYREDDIATKFPQLRYLRVDRLSLHFIFKDLNSNWHTTNVHTLEITSFYSEGNIFPNLYTLFPHLHHLIIREKSGFIWSEENIIGGVQLLCLILGETSYNTKLWESLPKLEVFTFQFMNHAMYTNIVENRWCECNSSTGTNDECRLKNIVETRRGYNNYIERQVVKF